MAKKGYFILTDISGYTEFLTRSELDHVQDALQNLFDVQLAHIKYPFLISGFRGYTIFMYVPEEHFFIPQTLPESLENLLVQTRRLVETPAGTRIVFYLRKADIPITEELTKLVVDAYNQAAAGLINKLALDFS